VSEPIQQDEEGRIGGWVLTFTKRKFWPLDPRPGDYCIEDIAHSLARICRFGGHVQCEHYSVAQHCVLISEQFTEPFKRYVALMHDAAEAYPPGDILRPLKKSDDPGVAYLLRIQDNIERVLRNQFCIPEQDMDYVKHMDKRMLVTESRDVRGGWHPDEIFQPPEWTPLPATIVPWRPELAEEQFMATYLELQERLR
jgi:5'-nucleotidase